MTEAAPTVSFDEFLVAEREGGTERHDTMVEALRDILGRGARAAGCRRFTGNRLVRTFSAGYYPDLLIVCGRAGDTYYETDACLIVEVRSPSTADDRRVDVAERRENGWSWETYGPGSVVLTPYGDIDLAASTTRSTPCPPLPEPP